MKTIFITIYDGAISKNILKSDIFSILKSKMNIVLFVPAGKVEYYKSNFLSDNVWVEAFPKATFPKLEIWMSQIFINSIYAQNIKIRINYNYANGENGLIKKFLRLFLWQLGKYKIWRNFLRLLYSAIPDHSYDAYFKKYKPQAIYTPNMISHEDMRIIKGAHRYDVMVIGMMKSWDNITSKAFVAMRPDWFIAQNEIIKKEMVKYLDFPENKIYVTGWPQFDIYIDKNIYQDRALFCQKLGLDFNKKIILYCGAGLMIAPYDIEVLKMLIASIEQKKIKHNVQILFRLHPKYSSAEEGLDKNTLVTVDRPGGNNSSKLSYWEFEEDDIVHLANSLYHSDVVVCTASTMNIESAIFDKPVVNPAFDGERKLSTELSVSRRYKYDHQLNINNTNGIKIAYSADDFIKYLNEYFYDPSIDHEGRNKIVAEQCYKLDGLAGHRIAEFIIEKIESIN